MRPHNTRSAALFWAALSLPVMWLALLIASCCAPGRTLGEWLPLFTAALEKPYMITWNAYSLKAIGVSLIVYAFAITAYYSTKENRRPGEEHGSARWGNPKQLNKRYMDRKNPDNNFILTQNVYLGMDVFRHRRNMNILVIGGSGSGKSRSFAMPNAMQAVSGTQTGASLLITDPKGEAARALAPMFLSKGIPVTVFDLVDVLTSDKFNAFVYIHTDLDALRLVNNLIKNTTPKGANQNDPFWEKAETALLSALILYLKHEAPEDEQNFPMVMYLIENAAASEDDDSKQSPVDIVFEMLEERDPNHIALRQYKVFKQASGKTAKSILVSAAVRLAAYNLSEIARLSEADDMDFASLGEKQRVIFAIIPDSESTLNYMIGMLYTCAFTELYHVADKKYGGALPIHVKFILDEFANVALPDDFEKVLSTCRSRNISISIILQNMAQLKGLFKDTWENIPGNTDTILYLGGNEQSTHEYFSKSLGKETLDTRTRGVTKGRNGSSSTNYQNAGRELMTPDEVRALDNRYALLFIRGEAPVLDLKYDISKHPNYELTAHGGAKPYVRQPPPMPEFRRDLADGTGPDDIEITEQLEESMNEE